MKFIILILILKFDLIMEIFPYTLQNVHKIRKCQYFSFAIMGGSPGELSEELVT